MCQYENADYNRRRGLERRLILLRNPKTCTSFDQEEVDATTQSAIEVQTPR